MNPRRYKFQMVLAAAFFAHAHQAFTQQPIAPLGIAEPAAYLADISKLLKQHWPKNRIINLVCHGHSVPAGYFKTPVVDTFNAYPHLIHRALKERYPMAVINVIVTAIGGEASESGAARFERDVLTLKPDLVLIDYGLNDRGIGLLRAKKAWKSMIEKAQAQKVNLLLLTPTGDLSAKLDDPADPLNRHAEQIRLLAQECRCGLVDSNARFGQYVHTGHKLQDLMSQVNHPNRKGHDLVVEAVMEWFPK
ncbi:MAG: SGNH/GDSL hydrolase family protein [Planctomycetota bacterium]